MSTTSHPFYTRLNPDNIAFSLIEKGKMHSYGEITKQGENEIDPAQFQLDVESINCIQKLFDEKFTVDGRCSAIAMGIENSVRKRVIAINNAALKIFGKSFDLILNFV